MKTNVYFIFMTAALCLSLSTTPIFGQIITPAVRSNFGTDADLSANLFDGLSADGADDWFINNTGAGEQIIDTTGASEIVNGYINNPATRRMSFSRLMNKLPFSIINGKIVLDAVFHRDYHGDDSTVFAAGSNKNGMNPADWSCPVSQSIPDKNEILDVFAHVRRDGSTMTDSLWMFGAISLENTTGNRYFDFEVAQTDMYYDMGTQHFMNCGPDSGHTSWKFDAFGNIIQAGDIIFSAEFSSAALTNLEARIWVNRASLSTNPEAFNWGGQFDGATNGSVFGYASIIPKTSGNYYTGLQSSSPSWAGPFMLIRKDNSLVANYTAKQFMEFSVNLSKLGLDPAAYSVNICNSPFRRVLVKTRASTSFSSELKDFVGPLRMFETPPVDAYAHTTYFCGNMPSLNLLTANPNPFSTYTWSTNDGNIVGSNTGNTILVDQPGTYYVAQQFHSQCFTGSIDSIKILFDTACATLNASLLNFTAIRKNSNAELDWKVNEDNNPTDYDIEFSLDNRSFLPVGHIHSSGKSGNSSYHFTHSPARISVTVFYRIKITGASGAVKYSRILPVSFSFRENVPLIYPNPSQGEAWVSITGSSPQVISINIFDSQGRQISRNTKGINAGDNILKLQGLEKSGKGTYFIKIITGDGESTQPLIIR